MATSTLLQIVQDMLVALEAEGVTTVVSGSTTEEALLCVNIANRTFEELITRAKWKHIRTWKNLTAGSQLNELKAGTADLYIDGRNVYYGVTDEESLVTYVTPEDFISRTISRKVSDANVVEINNYKIYNDRNPTFFTTIDDETLIFDAMPSGAGLVAGDSLALVYVEPTTRLSANAGVYDLPRQIYPHFRDLCIANALIEIGNDETKGERKALKANRQIAKIASSGNLIEKDDNAYSINRTRPVSGKYTTRKIIT